MTEPTTGLVDRLAFLTRDEFEELPEYSTSLPTGTTVGKRWKKRRFQEDAPAAEDWLLCEYVEVPEEGEVGIRYQPIVIASEVVPPGHERPIRVIEEFVHEPHAPDEDCRLGDACEAPRLEWGVSSSPPRPYLVPQPWADLRKHGREVRQELMETRVYRLLTQFVDWLADRLRTEPETCDACGRDMLPAGRVAGRVVRWKCPSCPIEKVPHR